MASTSTVDVLYGLFFVPELLLSLGDAVDGLALLNLEEEASNVGGEAIQDDDKDGGDKALEEEAALDALEDDDDEILVPAWTMLGLRSGGAGGGRFKSE